MKDNAKFSNVQNAGVTFGIVLISYAIAILVPTIGDAMTILGATTNSGIGFLIPVVFYLKLTKGENTFAQRAVCYLVFGTICLCSVITLVTFV